MEERNSKQQYECVLKKLETKGIPERVVLKFLKRALKSLDVPAESSLGSPGLQEGMEEKVENECKVKRVGVGAMETLGNTDEAMMGTEQLSPQRRSKKKHTEANAYRIDVEVVVDGCILHLDLNFGNVYRPKFSFQLVLLPPDKLDLMYSSLRDVHDTIAEIQEKRAADMVFYDTRLVEAQEVVSQVQKTVDSQKLELEFLHKEVKDLQMQLASLRSTMIRRTSVKYLCLAANDHDAMTNLVRWNASFPRQISASHFSLNPNTTEVKILKAGTYSINARVSQPFLQPTLYMALLVNGVVAAAAATAPPISGGGKTSGSLLQYVNQVTEILELNINDIISIKCGAKEGKGCILLEHLKNRLTISCMEEEEVL